MAAGASVLDPQCSYTRTFARTRSLPLAHLFCGTPSDVPRMRPMSRSRSFDALDASAPPSADKPHFPPRPAPDDSADVDADLDDDDEFFASLDESSWELLDASTAPVTPMFKKANGQQLKPMSQAALQQAAKRLRLDEDDDSEPISKARRVSPPSPAPRPAVTSSMRYGAFSASPATPGRPAPAPRPVSAPRPRASPIRTPLKTLGSSRPRISLGLTPRRTGASPAKPFVSPFKKDAPRPPAAHTPTAGTLPHIERPAWTGPRLSLRDAGIFPTEHSWETALRYGVPLEACMVLSEPVQGARYVFAGPDGTSLGIEAAIEHMRRRGCVNVSHKWAQNHWHLVLWKFAAYAAAVPAQARSFWSWERMLDQLCYRYDREQRHQYSAIKQIQEHRTTAARPVVLCVHHVLRFTEEDGSAAVMLELSDGWYRIRAEIDPPLRRAVDRGKIRTGMKLAIAEARLQSLGDGTPVLDALGTSELQLSGNSTSLARWDARLGFQRQGYASTLARLDPDGGVVSAMDIVIDRVYPVGYVEIPKDARPGSVYGPEHGSDEEGERQSQWDSDRMAARTVLVERRRRVESVVARLDGAVLPIEPDASVAASVAARLHTIETQSGASDAPLDGEWLGALLWAAQQRASALAGDEALDVLCPPRMVRQFRVVRFHDLGGSRAARRTVQLTVWDPKDDGLLSEGRALRVTHLIPIRRASWRRPEISADVFLATTASSHWFYLQACS